MTRVACTAVLLLALVAAARSQSPAQPPAAPPSQPSAAALIAERERSLARLEAESLLLADDRAFYRDAAKTAWAYGQRHYRPATGLIAAVPFYEFATVWDIGSSLAMLFAARELGFIGQADYDGRMQKALSTLARVPLFDNVAFNKTYSVSDGAMVDRLERVSATGEGWSVTDIGRLLVWLRIIASRHPQHAAAAAAAARRVDLSRLTADGYLWGEDLNRSGTKRRYQEGQLGYEQYAAQGFALWGADVDRALRVEENAIPVDVLGQEVAADKRQRDRLTSEPFVLIGLETGWLPGTRRLARAVLAAQAERARRTGVVTIVSEDAISRPPHFFYYYCVFANARQFSIDVQNPQSAVDSPRWVSTKAAFAWHALFPGSYTRRAVMAVAPARESGGWASGVFENTSRSTGTINVNTAAVVMTAALYALTGEPMLPAQAARSAS